MLYCIEMLEPGKGGRSKDFRIKHPAPDGSGWHYGLGGDPKRCACPKIGPVLYGLPALLDAPADTTIYIPEGESKCQRLKSLGLVATCNPFGAGKWQPQFGFYLHDRRVIILVDHDDPGRRHGQQVAAAL